jgi:hypothetical protein
MAEEKEEGSALTSWNSWEIIMDAENEPCEQDQPVLDVYVEMENSEAVGNGDISARGGSQDATAAPDEGQQQQLRQAAIDASNLEEIVNRAQSSDVLVWILFFVSVSYIAFFYTTVGCDCGQNAFG